MFSLREIQLQKDPGHRSSVFQPLGKIPASCLTFSQQGMTLLHASA